MTAETSDFSKLKLNSWLVQHCKSIGVKKPTPIQEHCIPHILAGEDCIGCAKTGTGKTLAFALPIVQKLSQGPFGIFALILTPTRELAYQIADQFSAIGQLMKLKVCVIVGGMDMLPQSQELAALPHIVVATPGRLVDHLESSESVNFKRLKFLVLDEADRMLGGPFDEQIGKIFRSLPTERQSLFFSATLTDTLNEIKKISKKQVFVWVSKDDSGLKTIEKLDQRYILCPDNARDAYLVEVVRTFKNIHEHESIIIFTDTCKNCQLLSIVFNKIGFENVALHAMVKQKERLSALNMFKSNRCKILIATEVAARGLDIPLVTLVINHRLTNVPKEYIHRVGRTARAGRSGMAISLVSPNDINLLKAIEEEIGTTLSEFKVDDDEIVKIFTEILITKSQAEITLDESEFFNKKLINKRKKLILEGKEDLLDDDDILEEIIFNKKRKVKLSKNKIGQPLSKFKK